jgi:hypothetical protein
MKPDPCFDFGIGSLKVLCGDRGIDLPLERTPGGALTDGCRERLRGEIRRFLGPLARGEAPAQCGVAARGVSLRRIDLPAVGRDELFSILALQAEKEFPLPLDRLAWGFLLHTPEPEGNPGGNGSKGVIHATVVAVRKEIVEDYATLLGECGLHPVFSVGAIAAASVCPGASGDATVLDIGSTHSEVLRLQGGRPVEVRCLPWGAAACLDRPEYVVLGTVPAGEDPSAPARSVEEVLPAVHDAGGKEDERFPAIDAAAEPLLRMLREAIPTPSRTGRHPLFILGGGSRIPGLAKSIARGLGDGFSCKSVKIEKGPGLSAVTVGLDRLARSRDRSWLIGLDSPLGKDGHGNGGRRTSTRAWALAAGILALLCISLRYAGPLAGMGGLEGKVESARAVLDSLPKVDRELSFLAHLESSRTPFLDALAVLARAAPKGTQVGSVGLSHQGELNFQGSLGSFADVGEFRTKLSASKWFSQVVIQEQTPSKDRSRIEIRLAARLAPPASRPALVDPAPGSEPEPPEPEVILVDQPPPAPPPPPPAPPPTAPPAPPGGSPPGAPSPEGKAAPPQAAPSQPNMEFPPDMPQEIRERINARMSSRKRG